MVYLTWSSVSISEKLIRDTSIAWASIWCKTPRTKKAVNSHCCWAKSRLQIFIVPRKMLFSRTLSVGIFVNLYKTSPYFMHGQFHDILRRHLLCYPHSYVPSSRGSRYAHLSTCSRALYTAAINTFSKRQFLCSEQSFMLVEYYAILRSCGSSLCLWFRCLVPDLNIFSHIQFYKITASNSLSCAGA